MSVRSWIAAALTAVVLVATPARAASTTVGKLVLKESMSQRVVHKGRGAARITSIDDRPKITATYDMAVEPVVTAAFDKNTRIAFRLGTIVFDGVLGDDPNWRVPFRTAKLALPPTEAAPTRIPGWVTVTWTGRHVYIAIKAKIPAFLAGLSRGPGGSSVSVVVDSSIHIADFTWYFLGSARGGAKVGRKTPKGAPHPLIKAVVAASGIGASLTNDRTSPTVRIDTPVMNTFLSTSPVAVSGVAGDDQTIAKILYSLDGGAWLQIPYASIPGPGPGVQVSYFISLDVVVEGLHRVRVRVYDEAGNMREALVGFVFSVSRPGLLATGDRFALAVHDGPTLTWGLGVSGQLGDGTFVSHPRPTEVLALDGAVAVASGLTHTVVLFSDGTVRTCGGNAYGQLGVGTRDDSASVVTPAVTGVVAVAAGNYHTAVLKSDGTVWCWGANGGGQIGDGTGGAHDNDFDRLVPTRVSGLSGVASISSGGDANVAVLADGTLYGWGDPRFGQVPGGLAPKPIAAGLASVVEVAVGGVHVMARLADGTVWTWGYRKYGSIGDGTAGDSLQLTPKQVPGVANATGVAASASSCAVLRADHGVVTWGDDEFGELGDGGTSSRSSPVNITTAEFSEIVRVSSSGQSVDFLAERADHSLFGWGRYAWGDPLAPTITTRPTPLPLP